MPFPGTAETITAPSAKRNGFDYLCHCEPQSGVAISSTMYPLEMHRLTSNDRDFLCEFTFHRIRLWRWRLPEGELPEGQERPPWGAGLTALAMTVVVGGWPFGFGGAVIVPDRRGQCRPPYGSNSIRRAETSDRSGGFGSPYGSHNSSGTSLPAAARRKKAGRAVALPAGKILMSDSIRSNQYAERESATGRAVSARFTTGTMLQARDCQRRLAAYRSR